MKNKSINLCLLALLICQGATHAMDFGGDYNFGPSYNEVVELYTQEQQQQKVQDRNQMIFDAQYNQKENELQAKIEQEKKVQEKLKKWQEEKCTICLENHDAPTDKTLWIKTPCCNNDNHWNCLKKSLFNDPRCVVCRQQFILPKNIQWSLNPEERNYFLEKGFFPKPPLSSTELVKQMMTNSWQDVKNFICSKDEVIFVNTMMILITEFCYWCLNQYDKKFFENSKAVGALLCLTPVFAEIFKYIPTKYLPNDNFLTLAQGSPIIFYGLLRFHGREGIQEIMSEIKELLINIFRTSQQRQKLAMLRMLTALKNYRGA